MTDVAAAEKLWVSAHDHVRRGALELAVRDLAGCFELLQALGDPRAYGVHKRWVEVHTLLVAHGALPSSASAAWAPAPAAAPTNSDPPHGMNKPLAVEAAALRAAGVAVRGDTPVAAPDDAGSQAEAAVATAAPPMAAGDVPIGMQSLEVPFSVADTIDARDAERLPVRDAWAARVELVPLAPPPAVAEPPWSRLDREASDIAFLGSLLVRVRERRRSRTP